MTRKNNNKNNSNKNEINKYLHKLLVFCPQRHTALTVIQEELLRVDSFRCTGLERMDSRKIQTSLP